MPWRGDGLDAQDVAVGRGPAGFARLDGVVVAAADDQVPGRGLGTFSDPHRPGRVDQAEVDEVVADPLAEFSAAGPVSGHQQDIPAGQVAGDVGADGLVHGLVGWGAAEAAVLVVFVQRGGIPGAQP